MPQFDINLTVSLTAEEVTSIADSLQCNANDLATALAPYAKAAMYEYADMFGGHAMIGIADQRERRLVAILLALPAASFPSDDTIARLFNLTVTQGRGLLRATLSRHRNRLKTVMDAAARLFIAACQESGESGERSARFPNAVVIEMLNNQLAMAATPRAPIRRQPGTFDTYIVANGAWLELQSLYP